MSWLQNDFLDSLKACLPPPKYQLIAERLFILCDDALDFINQNPHSEEFPMGQIFFKFHIIGQMNGFSFHAKKYDLTEMLHDAEEAMTAYGNAFNTRNVDHMQKEKLAYFTRRLEAIRLVANGFRANPELGTMFSWEEAQSIKQDMLAFHDKYPKVVHAAFWTRFPKCLRHHSTFSNIQNGAYYEL